MKRNAEVELFTKSSISMAWHPAAYLILNQRLIAGSLAACICSIGKFL
jgi:hypothetical protein